MWPNAQRAGAATGVDPRIIFAQSALETGWGKSAPNNNYFGIKGSGSSQTTREYINGRWVTIRDSFRGYSSAADSADGYASFINSNPRYASMRNAVGMEAQLDALGRSGYATDPNYINKLSSIIDNIPGNLASAVSNFAANMAASGGNPFVAAGMTLGNQVTGNSVGEGGVVGWLRNFFSINTATRAIAIIIGILLITVALIVLVMSNETVQSVAKRAVPLVGK